MTTGTFIFCDGILLPSMIFGNGILLPSDQGLTSRDWKTKSKLRSFFEMAGIFDDIWQWDPSSISRFGLVNDILRWDPSFEVRDALDLLIHVHSKTKIMRCDRRRYSGSWSFSFDFITREKGFVSMNSHGYRRCSWSFSFVFQTFWFNFITRESFLCIHRIPT